MARRFGRVENIARLRAARPAIVPSLLACDFGHLAREIDRVENAGVTSLHLDVMDGHFVPNLSFGIPIVETVRRLTELPLDVHLMINEPGQWVQRYRDAGADGITIHVEAVDDPRPVLDKIRGLGAWAGLAFNPATPLSAIEKCLRHCDLLLAMSVMPGFGGQTFDEVALAKLRTLRERPDVDALLEVDGGINIETVAAAAKVGADLLVAGTAVFHCADYAAALDELRSAAVAAAKKVQHPSTVN